MYALHENARYKGMDLNEGNVASYMAQMVRQIQVNDGVRKYTVKTEDCHDCPAPVADHQETTINLTNRNHMISQMEDGFISCVVQLTVQLTSNEDIQIDDCDGLGSTAQVFVGWKNAAEMIDQYQLMCNNQSTGIQVNEATREAFAYHNVRSKDAKRQRFSHTLWENVDKFSPSVCGAYIPLSTLADKQPHVVTFEANIAFTDIRRHSHSIQIALLASLSLSHTLPRKVLFGQCQIQDMLKNLSSS